MNTFRWQMAAALFALWFTCSSLCGFLLCAFHVELAYTIWGWYCPYEVGMYHVGFGLFPDRVGVEYGVWNL